MVCQYMMLSQMRKLPNFVTTSHERAKHHDMFSRFSSYASYRKPCQGI